MNKKKGNSIWQDGFDFNMEMEKTDMTGFDELLDFSHVGESLGDRYVGDQARPAKKNKFVKARYAQLKSGEVPLDQAEEYNFQRNQNLRGEDYY